MLSRLLQYLQLLIVRSAQSDAQIHEPNRPECSPTYVSIFNQFSQCFALIIYSFRRMVSIIKFMFYFFVRTHSNLDNDRVMSSVL